MIRARIARLALAAVLPVAAGCAAGSSGGDTGDGAAPATFVDEATVAPGQTVHVTAVGLLNGCDDTSTVVDGVGVATPAEVTVATP